MHYLLYGFLLLRNCVFPIVAAVLASALGLFESGGSGIDRVRVEKAKCGKKLVIRMLEFIEEFVARLIGMTNVEGILIFR